MRQLSNVATVAITFLLAGVAPGLGAETPASPSAAATAAAMPDCAHADKAMMAMAKPNPSMTPSGDLDRDFMAMATQNAHIMADAAKIEMACTKKHDMHDMAEAVEKQNIDALRNLQIGQGSTH